MVTFNDLLSWSGTNLFEAGDALVAASHKYEQVNADLKKDGLGDGLSGKTFEAEAKARRILADDAEDLWTGLEKAGNDLKDASTTAGNDWIARSGYYGGTVGGGGTAGYDSDFTALSTKSQDANGSHGHLAGNSGHSGYIPSDPQDSDPKTPAPRANTCVHNQGQILRGANPDYVDDYSINAN